MQVGSKTAIKASSVPFKPRSDRYTIRGQSGLQTITMRLKERLDRIHREFGPKKQPKFKTNAKKRAELLGKLDQIKKEFGGK